MARPFEQLGLSATASVYEVKTRWRELAGTHHPDRGGEAEAFGRLQKAYREALAIATTRDARCPACQGTGEFVYRRGFASIKGRCPTCRGTGLKEPS